MAYAAPSESNPAMYSNWGLRVGAYLIDYVPIIVLDVIATVARNGIVWFLFAIASLAWWIYNRCIQAGRTGQSLGKRALHMRLISDRTGEPIGGGMAFARDICHILDSLACYIGWLFPLWDAKRQTFADKIISTVVVPE
ncbi:MAG: RDD family protein [Actinobacteria bacterium]|nr:RDD family protein [Actinomycetota bacterium]